MANILFIAYDYPPVLSPEAIQVQRRALTLARNGHKIYVITSHENPAFEFIDNSLINLHDNIVIFHTQRPLFEKLLNAIFKIIDITDRKFWWQYFSLVLAKKLIKEKKITILYTHSTPLIDHLIGLKLKRFFPYLTWIAHFSDPWTLNPYKDYKTNFQKQINESLEIKILQNCDTLTVTSTRTKELFEKNFSFLANKISVLPHTFDERLYTITKQKNMPKIVVHTGNIYGLRTIEFFLEALKAFKLQNIEFHFYGKIKESELKLINQYSLHNIVKVYSQVPYLESLNIILSADYLMVVDAPLDNSPFFPSKLADYLGAKKPIIALTPKNSATHDILKNVNNANFIASSDSIEEIKHILQNLNDPRQEYTNIEYYSMNNYDLLKDIFEK